MARSVAEPWWRNPVALITGAAVLGGLLLVAIVSFAGGGNPAPSGTTTIVTPAFSTPTDRADGRALGAAGLPTLEVWSDNQCPACGFYWREVNPQVVQTYVNTGKVRLIHRDVPFIGAESTSSAIAARCADAQRKFWPYHDVLIANQRGENLGWFSDARLAAIADAVGLDRSAYDACVVDPVIAAAVQTEKEASASVPVRATPTLVLLGQGGAVMNGVGSFAELATKIDAWLGSSAGSSPGASSTP